MFDPISSNTNKAFIKNRVMTGCSKICSNNFFRYFGTHKKVVETCFGIRKKTCKAYSQPCQTSKLELFANIVNGFQTITIFANRTVSDFQQGSKDSFGLHTFFKSTIKWPS